MAMYSIGVTPLINTLQGPQISQVWFADDATAGGSINGFYDWWCALKSKGPSYGYFVNTSKTWLIVKPEYRNLANEVFRNTGISVTSEGKRHLRASTDSWSFTTEYVKEKVQSWISFCRL